MKAFVIYDDAGAIVRSGVCPDEDFVSQIHNDGEHILEVSVSVDPNVFRVENGVVVAKEGQG